MPYVVVETEKGHCVYKRGADKQPEGDTLGCHPTPHEAYAQIAAIEHSEAGKAIGRREDVSQADRERAVAEYGDVRYADEKNKKYPLDTEDHIRAAWNYIHQDRNRAQYRAEEVATIERKIVAAWKDNIDKDGPPASKAAVKAVGDWELDVLGCPYGGPHEGKDAQGEYFSGDTQFHEDRFGLPPAVYYHGFNPDGTPAGEPVFIGKTTEREVKPDGIWYRVVLDKANDYARRVWDAAQRGIARASSGAVAHLVRTDHDGHIRHWPVAELSIFDAIDGREPANSYAVALPVMKAVYRQAGLPLPAECEPQVTAGEKPRSGTASEGKVNGQKTGERTMDEKEIKTLVAGAVAEAFKAQADAVAAAQAAEKKRQEEIDAAVKAALRDRDEKDAKAGRLPDAGVPAVNRIPANYDHLAPAEHALMIGILDGAKATGKGQRFTGDRRLNAIKALMAKMESEKADEPSHEGLKALRRRGYTLKSNEIQQSTVDAIGDDWVGVAYGTAIWNKIRQATPVVGKLPAIEVPQGYESITIPLESTDPTFYKVAQAASLPTTEATGWPNATVTDSRAATDQASLTVAKMGARVLWTGELEEDSIIPWVPQLRAQLEKAAAEQMEYAIIDGDTATTASTNINDIAGTPASTDLFLMTNGFRCLAIRLNSGANCRAGGTLSVEDYLETLKLMGTAGGNAVDFNAVDFIIDPWVHWKTLELAEIKTRDSYAAPTLERGVLANIWGHAVHVSHFMCYAGVSLGTVTTAAYKLKSQTADGKVDQDTEGDNVSGTLLAVRWDQWRLGWKRRMTIETTRIARADTTEIVAMLRWGLIYRDSEASAATYGISV